MELRALGRSSLKVSVVGLGPLANGLLTGKYQSLNDVVKSRRLAASVDSIQAYGTLNPVDQALALQAYARRHGHTLIELALSWLAAQSQVASVITGATSPRQVAQNAVASVWQLKPYQLRNFDMIAKTHAWLTKSGVAD